MKQLIFTFERESDYEEFIESLITPLSKEVGKVEQNDEVIHIHIHNLKGDK